MSSLSSSRELVLDGRKAHTGGGATVFRQLTQAAESAGLRVRAVAPGDSRPRGVGDARVFSLSETVLRPLGSSSHRLTLARNLKAWGFGSTKKDQLRSLVAPRNVRRSSVTVCATSYFAEVIRARVPSAPVAVVRFGVDEPFAPEGRVRGGDYFLAVGDGYSHKNYPDMLHAFARSGASRSVRLIIAGRWPDQAELVRVTRAVESLGLRQSVEFVGTLSRQELAEAYRGAIVVVQWSEFESYCHPLVEATACGTGILCRDIPVARELVPDSAMHACTNDELAEAMKELASDPELANRLSLASTLRRRTLCNSWDQYLAQLLAVAP